MKMSRRETGLGRRGAMLMAAAVAAVAVGTGPSRADIQGIQLGTLAPPTMVGDEAVTGFPFDNRIFQEITQVPDGFGRNVTFSREVNCRQIGFGWATWSHGYLGNCYYTSGRLQMTVLFPRGTKAAYLYAEPGGFSLYRYTVTASDGVSTVTFEEDIHGRAGATGWAFVPSPGADTLYVTVSGPTDFSIGEFGISAPCLSDIDVDGFVDFSDFLLFLNLYEAADAKADFTGDGLVDFSDYLEFLNYYGNSCDGE